MLIAKNSFSYKKNMRLCLYILLEESCSKITFVENILVLAQTGLFRKSSKDCTLINTFGQNAK